MLKCTLRHSFPLRPKYLLQYAVFKHVPPMCGPEYLSRYSDSLPPGRSGDPIQVWARFSAPVQTGPGAYPTSYTMGTGSLSRG
jgi:hypothetical protein